MCLAVIVAVLAVYEDTASAGVSFRLSLGSGRSRGSYRSHGYHGRSSGYHGRSSGYHGRSPGYRSRSYYHRPYRSSYYYSRPSTIRYYPSSYYRSYSSYSPYVNQTSYYNSYYSRPTTTYTRTYYDDSSASCSESYGRVVIVRYIVVR